MLVFKFLILEILIEKWIWESSWNFGGPLLRFPLLFLIIVKNILLRTYRDIIILLIFYMHNTILKLLVPTYQLIIK